MSEFKAQSNAKRLKKVSRRLNEEYNYCRLMWSLSGARVLIKASSVHGRRTEENIGWTKRRKKNAWAKIFRRTARPKEKWVDPFHLNNYWLIWWLRLQQVTLVQCGKWSRDTNKRDISSWNSKWGRPSTCRDTRCTSDTRRYSQLTISVPNRHRSLTATVLCNISGSWDSRSTGPVPSGRVTSTTAAGEKTTTKATEGWAQTAGSWT